MAFTTRIVSSLLASEIQNSGEFHKPVLHVVVDLSHQFRIVQSLVLMHHLHSRLFDLGVLVQDFYLAYLLRMLEVQMLGLRPPSIMKSQIEVRNTG